MNQPSSRESDIARMVKAFNEWMRRYIETPEQYEREFKTVIEFNRDAFDGIEPSYGKNAAAYFCKLLNEIPV